MSVPKQHPLTIHATGDESVLAEWRQAVHNLQAESENTKRRYALLVRHLDALMTDSMPQGTCVVCRPSNGWGHLAWCPLGSLATILQKFRE